MEKRSKTTERKSKPNEIPISEKMNLSSLFEFCLDQMRKEHLCGDNALRELAYLLTLRLIEPRLGKQIDIDNYAYTNLDDPLSDMSSSTIKPTLLSLVRFSNLVKYAKEKEDNLTNIMKILWDEILSVHPKTKKIFMKDLGFQLSNQKLMKSIIEKLGSFPFENIKDDILGEAYEEVIQHVMTGRTLGQYFTPQNVKQMMIKLVNPQLFEDGKVETIFDPAMGTGGFLITFFRNILQQSTTKNIPIDYEYLSSQGIGGREAQIDTFQLAVSNMLISSGCMFDTLEKGDSIKTPITSKYDIVLANPPFGIKGLDYNTLRSEGQSPTEYLPIKSNNAVSLFLQLIIYILKVNGRCAVVMPRGKDVNSNKSEFVQIRKFLMKTCDLKEVISFPKNVKVFSHTSIETCVFYFVKKANGPEVLEIKETTTPKLKRSYTFTENHQTTSVKFYTYHPVDHVKTLVIDVPIDEIVKKSYSLCHDDYLESEHQGPLDQGTLTCQIKTLGDICKFLSKSKRPASYGKDQGEYPFYKSSMKVDAFVDEPDYDEESVIIGDGGNANVNYGVKFSASDHCCILQNKDATVVNLKYVYYFLYNNLDMMQKYYKGPAIKNISKSKLKNLEICLPSLALQEEIIKECEAVDLANKALEEEIQMNKMRTRNYIQNVLYR